MRKGRRGRREITNIARVKSPRHHPMHELL